MLNSWMEFNVDTRFTLACIDIRQLEADWKLAVPHLYAISPRIVYKTSTVVGGFDRVKGAEDLFKAAPTLVRQAWGYHVCTSSTLASNEGAAAGKAANKLDLDTYWWDGEDEWIKQEDTKRYLTASAFVKAFRNYAPSVMLGYNGYPWKASDMTLKLFDKYGPQNYGTRNKTIIAKCEKTGAIAKRIGQTHVPMIAGGRLDGHTRWTDFSDPKLLTALAKEAEISWYYGYGYAAQNRLTQDSGTQISLIEAMRRIKCLDVK